MSQVRALRLGEVVVGEVVVGGPVVPAMRVAPERRLGELGKLGELSEEDARRLLLVVLEVVDGRRPLPQLAGVVGEDVVRELRVVSGRLRLGRVRVCRVGADVAEISATVVRGERVLAVAARVEHSGEGWVCTVFKVLT